MSDYSQAIGALDAAPRGEHRRSVSDVTPLAALLLPSFSAVVFAVTLFQVLFLSGGAQTLFRDSDTGWHVRNGEAILRNAAVPRVDAFSYTRDGSEWFAWEWLSDVLLGGAHQIAGPAGVALLAALAIALTAWGVARLSLSLGGNFFFTAGSMVLLLGTTSIHWLARPHVFSWLLTLAFIAAAEHERRGRGGCGLYALPLLACAWANLHGSFLLGPAILFIYTIGEWLGGDRGQRGSQKPEARSQNKAGKLRSGRFPILASGFRLLAPPLSLRFAGACLASLIATFINPYGWRLHEHVVAYLNNDYLMDHIAEFRSFSFHSAGALYVELFLFLAVLGILALLRQRAFGPALVALAMLHMSLYSARHLPTAAVLLLPLSVAALTREAKNWPGLAPLLGYSERLRAFDRKVWSFAPVVLVLAAALAGLGAAAQRGSAGFNPSKFPVRAADFLERRDLGGRIFAKDQWGGYLIYRFAGRAKVFVDGRSDFYGQDFLETYAQVAEVKPGWEGVLKQYNVRFVMIPPDNALASVLALSSNWQRVYTDAVAAVFERVG